MKTHKRTSSPKKIKEKVVGDIVMEVLSQAPQAPAPPKKPKNKKGTTVTTERPENVELNLDGVDLTEIIKVDHTLILEELNSRIQELEKSLSREKLQVAYLKWLANDRMDALEVLTNNPWYRLLWMRFKGEI